MLSFPNAKINLGLRIVRKRTDGYHDLETIFYPIPLHDILEIIPAKTGGIEFNNSGLRISSSEQTNLCIKAYDLLKQFKPDLPAITTQLHKAIPIGAGLGGGSSDAAFLLKMLNNYFKLGLSTEQLLDLALQVGSDCPFFIINKPCFAQERGEILETLKLDLSNYNICLVNPGIHISTKWVFSEFNFKSTNSSFLLKDIATDIHSWKENMKNDLEEPVFNHYPEIKKIKDDLYDAGAIYSSMSGSGSTVYGIFEKNRKVELDLPSEYFTKLITV